jgi:phage tail sheath protein FI
VKCSWQNYDTETNSNQVYSSGVGGVFLRARVDAKGEKGKYLSISNIVLPITGVTSPTTFTLGKADASDALTDKQIMSVISHKGLRSWEYATCATDPIWQDARRVRILDFAIEAVLDSIFFAVDGELEAIVIVKSAIRGFNNDMIGNRIWLGGEIRLDEERTTNSAINAGKFYLIEDWQESPSPRRIEIAFNRADRWSDVARKIINKG